MKKLVLLALVLAMCLPLASCFVARSLKEKTEETPFSTEKSDLIGSWYTVSGSDDHTIVFYDNNTLEFIDGGDTIKCNYTLLAGVVVLLSDDPDISCFSFILAGETLIRYENGDADGYIYNKY